MFEDDEEDEMHDGDTEVNVLEMISKYEQARRAKEIPYFDHEVLEQMIAYYEENEQWKKAEKLIDYALEQHPYSTDFMALKAEALLDKNNANDAYVLVEKALSQDPLAIHLLLLKSDVLCCLGDYKQSLEVLDYVLTFANKEEKIDVYLEKADVFEEWENYEQAFENLKLAILLDPNNEEALDRIWFLMEFIGNYEECVQFNQKVIDLAPYSYLAWYNLANAYVGLERYIEAIEAFEMTLAINDSYEFAYSDCADTFMILEQYSKAIEYFEKAMQASKPTEEIYYQIGLCYEYLNQSKKARTQYRKALRLSPEFHEAHFRIAKTYDEENDSVQALNALMRANKLDQDNEEYLYAIAYQLFMQEDYSESCIKCMEATSQKPNMIQAWVLALINFYYLNETDILKDITELAHQHIPNSNELMMAEGCIKFVSARQQEGKIMIENAMLLNPTNIDIVNNFMPELLEISVFLELLNQKK